MDTFLYKEIWIKWKFTYLFILNNKGVIFREELRNLSILKIEFVFNSPVEYIYIYIRVLYFFRFVFRRNS